MKNMLSPMNIIIRTQKEIGITKLLKTIMKKVIFTENKEKSGIYMLTNKITNKKYIG